MEDPDDEDTNKQVRSRAKLTPPMTRLDSRRPKLGLHSKVRVLLINQLILMEMAPDTHV
jgi:hypothetical protein